MKKTKNFLITFSVAVILITSLPGCKKGADDPFFSIHSRKARVAGEWTYKNMLHETNYTSSTQNALNTYNSSGSSTMKVEGSTLTATGTDTQQSPFGPTTTNMSGNGGADFTITFDMDGTFKRKMEMKDVVLTVTESGDTYTMTINSINEVSGTWNFLGGIEEDYKDKERIILNILEEKNSGTTKDSDGFEAISTDNYTYASGSYNEVWQITKLMNKEMVLEADINYTGSSTMINKYMSISTSSTYTSTEKGNMNASLVQK